ncbi:putative membrane protein [Desulfosporosinus orientis DSM 765]|uniref:Putative membrane protein n=1 Tax=Desulfosporosinus orientis (strain ATCC 19365 / DSM 765 / NCIMB 8382 / VKM B-1628 / Singapore I) TaxID=768706 RepID=G7WCB8_DESOD|nr:DUF445 domain-containing protein [Desulfosporosinus orientis]AET70736.1 putative membrane protein [Desulfosporosinus orientis DSM 765]
MAKRNNTQSANLTLGGITLGFLVSYPFYLQGSFIGGLISSGCIAGMIGGLADWFAVTALFRRPLGIRPGRVIRTEIIPQNRERIFAALADMVQHELLSQEILRRKLTAWDFSRVMIRVFREQDVQETVSRMLASFGHDLLNNRGSEEVEQQIKGLIRENIGDFQAAKTLAEVIEFSLEHGEVNLVLEAICRAAAKYMDQPIVQATLKDLMESALARYEEKNPTRKMVGMFLPSSAEIAQGLKVKVQTVLQDGTVLQWLEEALLRFVLELKTKVSLQESINLFFTDVIDRGIESCKDNIMRACLGTSSEDSLSDPEQLYRLISSYWQAVFNKIDENHVLREKVNEEIRAILEKQINYHHNMIGRMVREGLEPLTDDKLVDLIEEKAGNDLQMIRINGSVVGGLAGMLIYLLGMVL